MRRCNKATRVENGVVESGGGHSRQHIRFPGEDVRPGALAGSGRARWLAADRVVGGDGNNIVTVARRPRVSAILATGDAAGRAGKLDPRHEQIQSNSPYPRRRRHPRGRRTSPLGIARDNADELREKLSAARDADLVPTSRRSSVTTTCVKQILEEQGNIAFWRVRMRPGKPVAFGLPRRDAAARAAGQSCLRRCRPSNCSGDRDSPHARLRHYSRARRLRCSWRMARFTALIGASMCGAAVLTKWQTGRADDWRAR